MNLKKICLPLSILFLIHLSMGCSSQRVYRYSNVVTINLNLQKTSGRASKKEVEKTWANLLSEMAGDAQSRAFLERLYWGLPLTLEVTEKEDVNSMNGSPPDGKVLVIRFSDVASGECKSRLEEVLFCNRNIAFCRVGDILVELRKGADQKGGTFGADYLAFRLAAEEYLLRKVKGWKIFQEKPLEKRVEEYLKRYRWKKMDYR